MPEKLAHIRGGPLRDTYGAMMGPNPCITVEAHFDGAPQALPRLLLLGI